MALDENPAKPALIEKRPYITGDMNNIMRKLFRFWWLFVIVGLLAGLAGYIYAAYKKPAYKSSLTFALDDGDGGGIGNFINLASQFGISVGGGKDIFAGDNILEIMKSRRMLERVLLSVDTFNNKPYTLIEYFLGLEDKWKLNERVNNIHFPLGQPKSSFSYRQDSLLYVIGQDFLDNYIVAQRPDRKLSIFEVSVTSPDEKFTKVFTERIVSETNKFYIEIRTKKAKETLDVLEGRVASMKGNLNSSIENKAIVQDVNINPAFSAAQVPVMRQQANIQVYGAAYGEMFKNLEMARFQYLNEIPLMQIIDGADYPMTKISLGKLKAAALFAVLAELLILTILGLRGIFKKE